MNKTPVNIEKAYSLLNPGSVVIVSVGDGVRDNLFTVTWNMPARKEPGMVAILSGKRHYSYPFIQKTGEFGINIPMVEQTFANLECRVSQVVDMGASSLLIAQIVAAYADENHVVNNELTFGNGLELLHHLGGKRFCISSEMIIGNAP